MLLDQQRTKRTVKIVAIICAVAFVGVLPIVLGLIIWGDNDPTGQGQIVKEAEDRVNANPNDVEALVELSLRYRNANRAADADRTLQRAIDVPPATADELESVVNALADTPQRQFAVLDTFTKANPKDGAAWLIYGRIAEQQTQGLRARLAFSRALANAGADQGLRQEAQQGIQRVATMATQSVPTPTAPGVVTAAP